ncbi:MAG TPA: PHB depolymerase family esterase [Candidatus Rifleibacterium sp.]|nr:PHB depolymerase family esterase [Candidatus Rifleibacterium sp.]HPT44898.1 PHB depolymerase family esterase [Candidatus Rifleibacterium sp.]
MKKFILLISFCSLAMAASAADWRFAVDNLLERGYENFARVDVTRQQYSRAEVETVAAGVTDWQALYDYLKSRSLRRKNFFQPGSRLINHLTGRPLGGAGEEMLLLNQVVGSDGVERPWVVYLPGSAALARPRALLVALHGGVSRQSIYENPVEVVRESPRLALARSQGWVLLFPFGQEGATWWDDVGMTNVRQLIRNVKHHVCIDDDRVYLAGFSDGASAGFLNAMLQPDDFAAVVALNGHMGAGSLDADLPLYAPNLAMTPVYAVTTADDDLFPTRRMAPAFEMATRAGARLEWRRLPGTHAFDYHASEMPLIARFLRQNRRNPSPDHIFWETGDRAYGTCRWLAITDLGPTGLADWHVEHNCIMTSEVITWGFSGIRANDGIKVSRVDRHGYAEAIGMRIGDVLRRAGGREITDSFSLQAAKEEARCGEPFEFVVKRDGRSVRLPGILPQPEMYYLFARQVPSAAVRAIRADNSFKIETSGVTRLQLRLLNDSVDFSRPVEVIINGRPGFCGLIKPDPAIMLSEYAGNRDRKLLPVAVLSLTVGDKRLRP